MTKQTPNPSLQRVARELAVAASEIDPPPCDHCWERSNCAATGHECTEFKAWCKSGKTDTEVIT